MRIAANIGAALVTPVQNWAARSQAKQQEAQYNQITLQNLQVQEQEIVQQRENIERQYETLRSIPIPETNRLAISAMIDKEVEGIAKKVKENYTNAADYLRKDAGKDLSRIAGMVANSEDFKLGIQNKAILAQYEEDSKKGLVAMMYNGKTFDQQLQDFKSGKTNKLVYRDPYKPSVEFTKYFQNNYGKDRFVKQQATTDEILQAIVTSTPGISMEQAIDQYTQLGYDKTPIYYKFEDEYEKGKYEREKAKDAFDMSYKRARLAQGERALSQQREMIDMTRVKTDMIDQIKGLAVSSSKSLDARTSQERESGKTIYRGGEVYKTPSNQDNRSLFNAVLPSAGLGFDKKTGIYVAPANTRFVSVGGNETKEAKVLSSRERSFTPETFEFIYDEKTKKQRLYAVGKVDLDEDELEEIFDIPRWKNTTYKGKYIGGERLERIENSYAPWNNDKFRATARVEINPSVYEREDINKQSGKTFMDGLSATNPFLSELTGQY